MKSNFFKLIIILVLSQFVTNVYSQKYLFSHGANLESWYSCDTSDVEFVLDDDQLLQAELSTNGWSCMGVVFKALNISEFEAFEINLKVDSKALLTYSSLMFKFKDLNGYMSIDPNEETIPIDTTNTFTKIYIRLDDPEVKRRYLNAEGGFNAQVTNSLLMYFRFETEVPENIKAKVIIDSIRFY